MKAGLPGILRRLKPPRRLRITFEGKWFLLITLGVGAAAINTNNNLLYLALSMNLSIIILSGLLSERCLRGLSVSVRPASEAFARRDALLAVTCDAGRKRFPALSVSVTVGAGDIVRTIPFPHVPAGESATRVVPFRPLRRGILPMASLTVSTRFPFALFEKFADLPARDRLVVYPEPSPAEQVSWRERAPDPSGAAGPLGRQGAQIRGARDRQPADPVRDIHWKASAHLGKWMVKDREGESAPVSELRLPVPCPPREFERAVSRACTLVLRWEREGQPYRLWIGDTLRVDAGDEQRRAKALAILATASADGTASPAGEETT